MTTTSRVTSARWYDEPKGDVHKTLSGVLRVVRDANSWRRDADEYHAALYGGGSATMALRPGRGGRYAYQPATLPHNVCRGAADTLTAKVAKHRPLPQVLTQNGDWKARKRGKKMTKLIEGCFYNLRIFEAHARRIVRDACVFGRGGLRVWRQGKRLKVERVHPLELFVDEWDARYGEPRNLYHVRWMDRGVVTEAFARSADGAIDKAAKQAIDDAVGATLIDYADDEDGESSTVDMVQVAESWHLCDDEEAHASSGGPPDDHECTGRHCIVVQGMDLVDEPWDRPSFPIALLHYNEALFGFYGQGLVEQLEGFQSSINYASERLEEMIQQSGVVITTPLGGEITDTEIRNGIGTLLTHKPGLAPQVLQFDLVNEHIRARPNELREQALNDAGLSQMSVQSEKPAGVEAAVAIQALDDIETERFIIFGRQYESWCLDVSRQLIACIRDIAKEFGDFEASVPLKGGMLPLSWKDVYVDGFELRIFPTSLLPQQLGARLEKLMQLFNSQVIDRAVFLRELDAPDLAAELDMETADKLNVDERLESMLETDDPEDANAYKPPTPYQDFSWAARRAQQLLNKAETDGAPDENLGLIRRYIDDCEESKARMAAEEQASQGPAPGLPPGPPPPDAMPPMPPPEMAMA